MSTQSCEIIRPTSSLILATCLVLAGISSGQPDEAAVSAARGNAKQALKLAIERLQETAGPDQRVTARADILNSDIARPNLTGVWNSWEIQATAPPTDADYHPDTKAAKFIGWLVSTPMAQAATEIGFASQLPQSPVTLMGAGTLGNGAPAESFVTASKVPVASPAGAYAWAVLDEGVKARINTPFSNSAPSAGAKTQQLGSGERPATEFMPGLSGLGRDSFEAASTDFADFTKGIGNTNFLPTAERIAPGSGAALKSLTHDFTLHSLGLFTDTARGGLRQDFSLLTNPGTLPSPYSGVGVYSSRLGITVPSDPRWQSFQQFARIYKDTARFTSVGGAPVLRSSAPSGWVAGTTAGTTTVVNRTPPAGVVLMPTIAKVQMLFSLVGRDIYPNLSTVVTGPLTASQKAGSMHGPLDAVFRNTNYDYSLHLLYTPIITLHNPYNVALEFTNLRVEFRNVPFAMKVYRNGVAQSTGPVSLETMYGDNLNGSLDKIFGLNLKTKTVSGTPGSTTFRLLPGEVKVFSPYIDPNRTFRADLSDRRFWDISVKSSLTTNIDTIPGWRGEAVGFDCDHLAGGLALDGIAANGHWSSYIALAWNDQIAVEVIPKTIDRANSKLIVKMSARIAGVPTVVNAIEMDYETPDGLQSFLSSNGATLPLRFPKATASPNYVLAQNLVDRASTPIASLGNVKPFALLSVQAKTTSGGRDASNLDGRLATKPWAFAHANIGASSQKVISEHPANHSHEFDLQLLNGSFSNYLSIDSKDRGSFISGHTAFYGARFGGQYDIPLAPIQTFASLNGANPGGSSGYLPRFAQPIGNSWAHPLLDASKIITTGGSYAYADHSFLLNLALYDGFYFSGLADQTGSFGQNKTSNSVATAFAAGTPLDDPRLILYRPDGQTAAAFPGEVEKSTAYSDIAAWQLMAGAFNINSTSVPAWKAMLASIHDSQALFNSINKSAETSVLTPLPAPSGKARISRFRLPASTSAADGAPSQDGYWLGPRELSGEELQTLAEKIVGQVRLRGPFLSMAEFVNRQLGEVDTAQRGALQQAIDLSNLNSSLANASGAGFEIPAASVSGYNYKNPTAGNGPSYQGAPGYLTQADILNVLGNAATARSDTFVVRSYGESHGTSGETTATAVCEAVIQRLPDWIDPADKAGTAPADLGSQTNKTLGRGFRLISFRWLADDEI